MRDIRSLDFFRKIPRDLTEGTVSGASLSCVGTFFLVILIILEFNSYLGATLKTEVTIDNSLEETLNIRFNVTMHHVPCEYLSLDVEDIMHTRVHDMKTNRIKKFKIDSMTGLPFAVIDHEVHDPQYDVEGAVEDTEKVEEAHEELEGADSFEKFVHDHDIAMVNFYAPWCIWCKRLHPTWAATAKMVRERYGNQVRFAKIDCTKPDNQPVCKKNHINAFPTIITYRNHAAHSHEHYHGDRTTEALLQFVKNVYDATAQDRADREERGVKDEPETAEQKKQRAYKRPEGCLISGSTKVKRVPGSILLTIDSKGMSFDESALNMSHYVNDFRFGRGHNERIAGRLDEAARAAKNALGGRTFASDVKNSTHEHYMKVVRAQYKFWRRDIPAYWYTVSSHNYKDDDSRVSAKFTYDLSPMSVIVSEESVPFYHFVTNLCAIIGGVFTVIGIIDSLLHHGIVAFRRKMQMGKQL